MTISAHIRKLIFVCLLAATCLFPITTSAVVNGRPDSDHEFGNTVTITTSGGRSDGVLVAPKVVFASAHGILKSRDEFFDNIRIHQEADGGVMTRKAVSIVTFPNALTAKEHQAALLANPSKQFYLQWMNAKEDIAIITLDAPLTMYQKIVVMPYKNVRPPFFSALERLLIDVAERDGVIHAIMPGYGATSFCDGTKGECHPSATQYVADLLLMKTNQCEVIDLQTPAYISERICVNVVAGVPWFGDSGGPLYVRLKDGSLLLLGTLSSGRRGLHSYTSLSYALPLLKDLLIEELDIPTLGQ